MTKLKPVLAILLVLFANSNSLFAQDIGPINTERPSFSSSPIALYTGFWQIEAGYDYSRTRGSNGSKEHTLPDTLLRFGFYERFEAQLKWSGYTWKDASGTETNGVKDASLGVKWQLNSEDSNFVVAIFAGISLPIGDSGISSDDYDPELALFWTYAGGLDWFGTAKLTESGKKYKLENAIGINLTLAENTGAYVEYEGAFPEGQGPSHEVNFGVTWLLADDLQVDVNGSLGLNSRASDYGLGAGIAYRF
jgi:hypothetical protein